MDVRLPNGAIIKNVPEGTTKAQLTEKLRANGYDMSALEPPSEGVVGYIDKTLGNIPRDVTNIGQGLYEAATDPLQTLQNLATAIENPVRTGAGLAAGAYKLARHPFDTFQEAPVSTALTVAGMVPVARGVAGVARMPGAIIEGIAKPEPGLIPGLRAEAQAAKEAGYAESKAAAEGQYNPEAFTSFLGNAKTALAQEGYKPKFTEQFGTLNKVMSTLEDYAAKPLPADITKIKKAEQYQPKPISLGDVEGLRREIGMLYKKGTPDEKRLATVLTNQFDQFWENPANALPGHESTIGAGASNLRIGIDKTHELFQDRIISSIVKKAENTSDFAQSLKKQFSKIVEDEKKIGRFSPDQQAIIRDIAEGSTTSPFISELAALAPGLRGRKLASFSEAALAYSHPYIAGGIAFAGKGAQLAANRAARKAVNRLAEETFKSKNAMAP
jgi:hypothetical protein